MTDTPSAPDSAAGAPETAGAAPARKRSGGLNSMLLADLKAMASSMGVAGANGMRKAQLIDAIRATQTQQSAAPAPGAERKPTTSGADSADSARRDRAENGRSKNDQPVTDQPKNDQSKGAKGDQATGAKREQSGQAPHAGSEGPEAAQDGGAKQASGRKQPKNDQPKNDTQNKQADKQQADKQQADKQQADKQQADKQQNDNQGDDEDGEGGSRRNRRRRGRDRTARGRNEPDTEVREDDVLVPAAGILDVLDNYAFVRTSGYLAGVDDVYLSLSLVRKYGLRSGDAVAGQVRQPRDGERREKFNPMVRIDTVNGADPEQSKNRAEFERQTPTHPQDRIRLETGAQDLDGRVIDVVAPLGKGQRGLILAPDRAGRTTLLRSIANSITRNHPDCHLMVVLVDERPEEVTDLQRAIKGEVIASTFDRPASDHTNLAELALERAKRLVELGHDVVVLLDGLTRLGRAYNQSSTGTARPLPGGVDAAALYPTKRLFGAARNLEDGGSLTILATARVESGSVTDEVILEEFAGTANWEVRLRRDLADRRVFPAVDPLASGTRREDQLIGPDELEILWKLRRSLADLDGAGALEKLREQLSATASNIEFLTRVQRVAES